ncbi:MAG: hypothetical protein AMK75_02865 [Planctomycetes bacterium SM23_65]|nr:MAG: hypothetical protein AMK75_02865 [Planctomycetes bacterium SM23_65]
MLTADVSRVIDRLVRRVKLVRALAYLVRSALAAAALLCLGLIWDKFQSLPVVAWQAVLLAAGLVVVFAAASVAVRPVSRLAAAKRADVRLDLDDRLSSACEFAASERPTRFMRAHIAETCTHLDKVRPDEAIPFRVPRELPLLVVAAVVVGLLVLLPGFARQAPTTPEPQAEPLPSLRFTGERTVDALLAKLDLDRDRRLAELMHRLKQLYVDVRAGELSREEALSRIGEVEARLSEVEDRSARGRTAHTWRRELEKSVAAKGTVLARHPTTADLGRAMTDLKLDEASEESRALADKATAKPPTLKLTPEQSKALAKLLTEAGKKDDRTLDVLSSHLNAAGRQLSVEDLEAFAKSLEETAKEFERLKGELAKLKGLARMDGELEELKEIITALRRDGTGRWVFGPTAGHTGAMGYLQLQGVDFPKEEREKGKPGVGDSAAGPGTGGEPTRTDVERTPRALAGTWGDGASLIEIVRGAASEGVATTAYKDVAEAAARLAEDAIHNEDIPLGYRFYIKRYFQLIRPPAEAPKETP